MFLNEQIHTKTSEPILSEGLETCRQGVSEVPIFVSFFGKIYKPLSVRSRPPVDLPCRIKCIQKRTGGYSAVEPNDECPAVAAQAAARCACVFSNLPSNSSRFLRAARMLFALM